MPSDFVSNSQLRTFKQCRRRYWLAYVRKLKPNARKRTGAAPLGIRLHAALQSYYDQEGSGGRTAAVQHLDALREQERQELPVDDTDEWKKIVHEHELATLMIEGYCDWLEDEGTDADLEVIGTEVVLRTASPVPTVDLVGKLDLVVRKRSTGEIGLVDHKTVTTFANLIKMAAFDEQFRQYALMQRLAQPDAPGLSFRLINMLKKSKRTARAAPPFFMRHEVYISDAELRAFWERLHGEILDLIDFERHVEAAPERHRAIAYPNPTMTCSWSCEFYTICPMFDDDNSDVEHVLAESYHEGDPHAHYEGQLDADDT